MTAEPNVQPQTAGVWWDIAALALLAGTATVLLASPAFPSGDGPVHLYYVDILRGLLTHAAPYADHFELKALVTPYALEYYALLALETVFSPLASEKILVGCYIFAFGFGFRSLIAAVTGERRSAWTLAGIPFCMNLLVYLGFLNYCLGMALALWLSGLWIRDSRRLTGRRVAMLLAGFAAMLLAHPVAVAVFLLFIGVWFVADVGAGRPWVAPLALMLGMDFAALAWVGIFAVGGELSPSLPNYAMQVGLLRALGGEIILRPVSPFPSLLYTGGLLLVVVLAGLTLLRQWRKGAIAPLLTSTICFALYCLAPPQINGTWYFPERFPVFGVLFLIAAAAAARPSRRWSALVGGAAACVTLGLISAQWVYVGRIGQELNPALETATANAGSAGLIVGTERQLPEGLAFDPFRWGGVHYFRRSKAILANTPWMEQTHIPLRPKNPDRWSYLDPDEAGMQFSLAADTASKLDFVMVEGRDDGPLDAMLRRMGWRSIANSGEFLKVYRRP